jgi:hypothetical protein
MSRNKINELKRWLKIQEITQKTLNERGNDVKFSAIWRNVIYPTYFISYPTYIKIINESRLTERIKELESNESETTRKNKRIKPPNFEYF